MRKVDCLCSNLKIIDLLRGLQLGYTNYYCFLCLWDSRARSKHYKKNQWLMRLKTKAGQHNELFYLLCILSFVGSSNFSKLWIKTRFPYLSIAKIKEGIFVGSEIRKLMLNKEFDKMLNINKLYARKCFKQNCLKLLGSHKAENFKDVVNLLHNYNVLCCKKVHFSESHLNFFYENLEDVSDEHGERFHQGVAILEKRFKGKCSVEIIADYCCFIKRDTCELLHKQRRR